MIPGSLNTPIMSEGFTPLDLFEGGQNGIWLDFSDTSTMWQDTSATTPVTTNGDPVARIDDKSGNGYNAQQATVSAQPTYDSSLDAASSDGGDFLTVPSSTATFSFMHKDTGVGIFVLMAFGLSADPNTIGYIMGNSAGGSANSGLAFFFDDRASASRNDTVAFSVQRAVLGQSLYSIVGPNGIAPAQTPAAIGINIPSGGNADLYADTTIEASAAITGTPSTANATYDLQIGSNGVGTGVFGGDYYQVIIRDGEFTTEEIAQIINYFNTKR